MRLVEMIHETGFSSVNAIVKIRITLVSIMIITVAIAS